LIRHFALREPRINTRLYESLQNSVIIEAEIGVAPFARLTLLNFCAVGHNQNFDEVLTNPLIRDTL
jgi:hypothetical protein